MKHIHNWIAIRSDLAPHSDAYCVSHGIRPAREDWAQNETVELPAVEFRRNVLVAAVEGTINVRR